MNSLEDAYVNIAKAEERLHGVQNGDNNLNSELPISQEDLNAINRISESPSRLLD